MSLTQTITNNEQAILIKRTTPYAD